MGPLLIPLIMAGTSIASAIMQNRANKKNLQRQLDYNTPANQMARYKAAGLNPNLVISQGNPGNQQMPLQSDFSGVAQAGQSFGQGSLMQSQISATNARAEQTKILTEVNKLQAKVLERNPLLDSQGFTAIIDSLKSTAEIKANESGISQQRLFVSQASSGLAVQKIQKEVALLEQRFKLSELDGQIKAQVVQSKDFQNAILEVQKKFMTEADITPQHILEFVRLLLMKLF